MRLLDGPVLRRHLDLGAVPAMVRECFSERDMARFEKLSALEQIKVAVLVQEGLACSLVDALPDVWHSRRVGGAMAKTRSEGSGRFAGRGGYDPHSGRRGKLVRVGRLGLVGRNRAYGLLRTARTASTLGRMASLYALLLYLAQAGAPPTQVGLVLVARDATRVPRRDRRRVGTAAQS